MHFTVTDWTHFKSSWNGAHNFLMEGDCVPFEFELPPLSDIVDAVRNHPEANIGTGVKGTSLDMSSIARQFRQLPIEEAMRSRFSIAHYHLSVFDAPGQFLHGFKERVLEPWQNALTAQGFSFTRCYPIIFISGADCATNYHMDFSHVVAWQTHGTKRFCGLHDPGRWAPYDARVTYGSQPFEKPASIGNDDELCYEMSPGTVLWNCLLTPHWVEAADEPAMSINISHGGLRLNGKLSPCEQELMEWSEANPDRAPGLPAGTY
jgi:hypothetical protein